MEVRRRMDAAHLMNLGLEFGDTIYVTGNGFSNHQGVFIAFQGDFLVWVTNFGGAIRILSSDTSNITIAS